MGFVFLVGPAPFPAPPPAVADAAVGARTPPPDRTPSERQTPSGTSATRAWPVAGTTGARPAVLRPWLPPPTPWAAGHRGVDLAARAGATVRAAAPGRVTFAGKVAGRGVLTIALTGTGRPPLRTTYEPVRPTVRKGTHVRAGQPVAVLHSGPYHCDTACLHWGLRRGHAYLDPLSLLPPSLLKNAAPRLLPVFPIPEPPAKPPPDKPRPPPLSPTATALAPNPGLTTITAAIALAATATWSHTRLRHRKTTEENRREVTAL
ncbi:M23 family metallopeptidase [Streptomyces sp. NPDC047117]|uniref:murein hydrolase activator EnvC family protein n=1 Tax=Streptomyces sp. NPDC047117 TaxID=3155379 RepID=UPI0033CE54C0